MIEIDEENCGPYDNVEFPIRQPGTGTWPRVNSNVEGPVSSSSTLSSSTSSSSAAPSGGNKYFGQHSLSRNATPRLAPLIEVEMTNDVSENKRNGPDTPAPFSSNNSQFPPLSPSATMTSSSSSSPSSSSSSSTQQQVSSVTSNCMTLPSNQTFGARASATANNTSSTVTLGSDTMKKKNSTLKQTSVEDEDFKRHDLNPGSRLALERVYNCHPDFYQLNSKILDEGSLLKQDVNDIYRKSGETLTYEQLLQGMMIDGERFLLGGCWLYFTYVQFLDVEGTRILREPYRRGRVGLTSKRALFLSTETFTDATLEPYGEPAKPKMGGFKLEVSKQSNVIFKNIPLTNFHSAEMEVVTGTSAQTKITQETFCCCFGRPGKWLSATPMTRSINSRVLRVGVSMPPWQTRMFMDIHLDPSMSLTTARDFISQLQQFSPHIN